MIVWLLLLGALEPAAEAQAQDIGRELRCPVCQGMPISESPADMAQAMMKRVRELQERFGDEEGS